jgi:uncharacterized protein (UPF0332 family)
MADSDQEVENLLNTSQNGYLKKSVEHFRCFRSEKSAARPHSMISRLYYACYLVGKGVVLKDADAEIRHGDLPLRLVKNSSDLNINREISFVYPTLLALRKKADYERTLLTATECERVLDRANNLMKRLVPMV